MNLWIFSKEKLIQKNKIWQLPLDIPARYGGYCPRAGGLTTGFNPLAPATEPAADVGVTDLDIGVVGFSPSNFLVDGVEALLEVPDLGLWGPGCSFLVVNLSIPFSLGEAVPLGGETGSSEPSSTTRSWSLFSPSLCWKFKNKLYSKTKFIIWITLH